jgi:hypothetical protein
LQFFLGLFVLEEIPFQFLSCQSFWPANAPTQKCRILVSAATTQLEP